MSNIWGKLQIEQCKVYVVWVGQRGVVLSEKNHSRDNIV